MRRDIVLAPVPLIRIEKGEAKGVWKEYHVRESPNGTGRKSKNAEISYGNDMGF